MIVLNRRYYDSMITVSDLATGNTNFSTAKSPKAKAKLLLLVYLFSERQSDFSHI